MQLTRAVAPYVASGIDWKDASIILPFVYDLSTNLTQLAERREPSIAATAASLKLRAYAEFCSVNQITETSLFPAIRDLLTNLTLPNEPQPPPTQPVPQQHPNPNQVSVVCDNHFITDIFM